VSEFCDNPECELHVDVSNDVINRGRMDIHYKGDTIARWRYAWWFFDKNGHSFFMNFCSRCKGVIETIEERKRRNHVNNKS
jgi:hypothetical protein